MTIEYRSVDADEVKKNAKRVHALEQEMAAYGSEVEVERLTALAKEVTTKKDKDAVKELLKSATEEQKARRARARAAKKNVAVTSSDDIAVHKEFLNRWIASLEQEHLDHTVKIAQKEDALEATDEGKLNEEEAAAAMAEVENSREALKVIETSWKVATKRLDALENPPKPAKKTTR
jgi:hypothetical protein